MSCCPNRESFIPLQRMNTEVHRTQYDLNYMRVYQDGCTAPPPQNWLPNGGGPDGPGWSPVRPKVTPLPQSDYPGVL